MRGFEFPPGDPRNFIAAMLRRAIMDARLGDPTAWLWLAGDARLWMDAAGFHNIQPLDVAIKAIAEGMRG